MFIFSTQFQLPFVELFVVIVVFYLASRIRGKVAQVPFDEFHRYSTSVIKKAVFGVDKDGKIKQRLCFDANQLVSKYFDVQSNHIWWPPVINVVLFFFFCLYKAATIHFSDMAA